jgi:hypothetical protein
VLALNLRYSRNGVDVEDVGQNGGEKGRDKHRKRTRPSFLFSKTVAESHLIESDLGFRGNLSRNRALRTVRRQQSRSNLMINERERVACGIIRHHGVDGVCRRPPLAVERSRCISTMRATDYFLVV